MIKPVILSVDDDPGVLRAVARDLRRQYGEEYRILRADSGAAGLEALDELKQRRDPVALFLVDQRMPHMNGIEFLGQAMKLYPEAKRALLTAYADTDAAINAINEAAVHYYLLKPWDPPEEKLFPVLDDLLEDWQASYRPPFSGIQIIGHRWSPETHELKDFLARNQVPYQYLDIEHDPEAEAIMGDLKADTASLPVVLLAEGEILPSASPADIAEKIGLRRQATEKFYDLAIVGGGPAGLAAAVYGASEGLRTVMIERQAPGGQAGTSSRIENYLGFPSGLSGSDLARRATVQAKRFGVEMLTPQEATSVRLEGPYRILTLADGSEISCHALIVAVGLSYGKPNIPGVERLTGAGVYYGASLTEVTACQDQDVYIIGAGNSAGQAALYLAQHAASVTLVVRGNSLGAKMSQYLVDRIERHPKITVRLQSVITSAEGNTHLECVTIRDNVTGQEETKVAAALFIFIGAMPCTEWLNGVVTMDRHGFVLTGSQLLVDGRLSKDWPLDRAPYLLESSVPGIFVVGDVRANSVKRVASAVGEGSIAVQFVHQYLSRLK
ncbi:MAG: FAD-dependent oxidoreductase [Anaerolineaceae bacterium]|nr:FAD-dependent oxidoreductase [Anaerolineaceae bacterium]MCB9100868.1 FAD-dependent oxidoreductase [Anaerolineales bacterium]